MRSLKVFSVLLPTLGLTGFMGRTSLLMAGENDAPHVTHLTHARGPHIGADCQWCHDSSPGAEAYDNVN